MQTHLLDLLTINRAFRQLAEARAWQAYHSPKNLAAAIAVESSELLEIFQWLTEAESVALAQDLEAKSRVADEVADILMYLTELCARLEINLPQAVAQKIEKNKVKYGDKANK